LPKGHPEGCNIAFFHGFTPEQQDIDALIGDAIGAQRARNPPGRVFNAPRFQPRVPCRLPSAL